MAKVPWLNFRGPPQLPKPSRLLRAALSSGPERRALNAWMPKRACVGALMPVGALMQSGSDARPKSPIL